MASPEFHALVAKIRSRPRQLDQTIEEARASMDATARAFPPSPDAEFNAVDANGVPAEWVTVPDGGSFPVILYFHGGGYCMGSAQTHRDLISRLCSAAGARALSTDYRLAPETPFPAALDDGVAAYRWLRQQGVPAKAIVVAGDSAGGGLALATLLALKEAGDELPAGAVCMSPVTDHAKEGESMRTRIDLDPMVHPVTSTAYSKMYVGGSDAKAPLASPLYGDLKGLPPLHILVGTWEVLLDDTMRFAAKAKEAGVPVDLEVWDEMIHIWPYFAKAIPEGRRAIDRMGAFIRRHTAASS